MNHYAVQGIRQTIATPTQSIITLRVPFAGTITRIDVWASSTVNGDAVFDVRRNGTSLWSNPNDRPRIASGQSAGFSPMNVTVSRGDVLTVDLVQAPSNGLVAPAFVSLTIDDGQSAGAIIVQDEGTSLPARGKINFTGAGVTATDDATNDRINVQISGGGGSAYSRYDPDSRPGSPSSYDDEFDASSLDSKWSLYRPDPNSPFNAPVMDESRSLVRLGARGNFSSGGNDATWSGIVQTAPSSGDWAFRTKVHCPTPLPIAAGGFEIPEMLGGLIAITNTGQIIALAAQQGVTAAGELAVRVERWSTATTFAAEIKRASFGLQVMPLYLEICKQGSTLTFRFSTDNLSWSYGYQWRYNLGTETVAQIGIGARFNASNSRTNYSSANPPVAYFDWFRRV